MKLTRQSLLVPALLATALPFAAYACSPDSPSLVCGPGTVAKNGVCLPTPEDASVVDSGPTETPDAAADAPAVDGGVVDAGEAPDPVSPPGTVHALFTNATNRFFTRDGRTLVVAGTKDGAQGVWRYDTRTQSVKKLADNATRVLALSADESFLLANAPDGIIRAKMDGSSSDLVYPRQAVDATPSADGKSVYYATTQQVRRVPLVRDGSDGETLYTLAKITEKFEGLMLNEATTYGLVRVVDQMSGGMGHASLQLAPGTTLRPIGAYRWDLQAAPRVNAWGDFLLTPVARVNIAAAETLSTRVNGVFVHGDFVYGLNSDGVSPSKVCRSNMRTLDPIQCFDATAGAGWTVTAALGRYVVYVIADQVFRVDTETGAVHTVARFAGTLQPLTIAPSGSHVGLCLMSNTGFSSCHLYRFEGGAFVKSPFTSRFTTVTGDESRVVYGNSSAKIDGTDVVQLADVAPNSVETFPSQASEVLFLSDSSKTLRIVEP